MSSAYMWLEPRGQNALGREVREEVEPQQGASHKEMHARYKSYIFPDRKMIKDLKLEPTRTR